METALMPSMAGMEIRKSVTESLEQEKESLLKRVGQIDEALAVLKAHPDVQKVIDVLSKHTRF